MIRIYLHKVTGEAIPAHSRREAIKYFKKQYKKLQLEVKSNRKTVVYYGITD